MTPPRVCTLESADSAEALLERYDPGHGTWGYPKKERFWDAVSVAHSLERWGQGVRLAVIDGSFDVAVPSLARQMRVHRPAPTPAAVAHGTAVALLASEVAPQAELLLYEVCDPSGTPVYDEVCRAIEAAVDDGAHIISLSLGSHVPYRTDADLHGGVASAFFSGEPNPRAVEDCPLCRAAEAAHEKGVTVVAAAGNSRDFVLCPARSSAVMGCGFQTGTHQVRPTDDGGSTTEAGADLPTRQSRRVDFTLEQADGLLGTSFATPLIGAFLALLNDRSELPAFLASLNQASAASFAEVLIPSGMMELATVRTLYEQAAGLHPHRHATGDGPCPACSLFGEVLYANYGRFLLNTHQTAAAESLLRIAVEVAPRSPNVIANLAATLWHGSADAPPPERTARLQQAVALYRRALEYTSAPERQATYRTALAHIEALLPPGTTPQ